MSRKLKDHVVESNQIELKTNLDKIIKKTRYLKLWCDKNIERSDKSILLCNILSSVADHIEITMNSLDMHISVLALATRSQYELNVRLRSIIESEDE